jgi:hypothetical protein
MLAGLPVEENLIAVTLPRLSAGGKPIGAVRKADAMPCRPAELLLRGGAFRRLRAAQGMPPGNELYFTPDRGIYLRPRAMRIDAYC